MSSTVADELGLDPTLPDVSIVIGGHERKLCFDFNSIVRAEKETGVNLLQAMVGERSATNIRGLLWSSLLHANPNLSIEAVGNWIRPSNIGTVWQAITAAWFGSVEEKTDDASSEASDDQGEANAQAATPSA